MLRGVALEVAAGQTMAIIGASGSGKSVLLKVILGLLPPDSGSVEVDGVESVNASRRTREQILRKIGMLFSRRGVV